MFPLSPLLRRLIVEGTLEVIDARDRPYRFGTGDAPRVQIRFHDARLPWRVLAAPSVAVGEGYMDGRLSVEGGQIYDFLDLVTRNMRRVGGLPLSVGSEAVGKLFRYVRQFNPAPRAKHNVAHHYDLKPELFELFLDRDRQYSCAYFVNPGDDLESAQENKKRHLAAKLALADGQRVLDIGCGWGGLGLYIARHFDTHVTGITLSEEQHRTATQRARAERLAGRATFELRDYRSQTGPFERVVSVGMFEHVGVPHYDAFFRKIKGLLTDDGVAVLHTIGRSGPPSVTDPWVRKYIFPGGYIPALSEVMPAIERAGLIVTDIEFLGPHYAETVRRWQKRFRENRDKVKAIYDERFCRMWEFYLAGSEVSFRHMGMTVFQIQMVKNRATLPLTRDYLADREKKLAAS